MKMASNYHTVFCNWPGTVLQEQGLMPHTLLSPVNKHFIHSHAVPRGMIEGSRRKRPEEIYMESLVKLTSARMTVVQMIQATQDRQE